MKRRSSNSTDPKVIPPRTFHLPTVDDGVRQVEEFVAGLVADLPATSVGIDSAPRETSRVVRFDFAGNGVNSWLVDHDCVVVGWSWTAGASPWQLAGHNPDPFTAIDAVNVGRHVVQGSGLSQVSGMRILFHSGDTMWVRNGTASTLTVSVFINNVN